MFYILTIHIFTNIYHVLKHNGCVKNSKVIFYVQNSLFEVLVGPPIYIMRQILIIHIHIFI
jgi:hypothetical protein